MAAVARAMMPGSTKSRRTVGFNSLGRVPDTSRWDYRIVGLPSMLPSRTLRYAPRGKAHCAGGPHRIACSLLTRRQREDAGGGAQIVPTPL